MKGEIERASAGHVEADATTFGSRAEPPASTREHVVEEEGSEPSYSQVLASGSRASLRPSMRPSVRPSAFGPPRASLLPKAPTPVDMGSSFCSRAEPPASTDEECEPDPFPERASSTRTHEAVTPLDEATPSGARQRAPTPETIPPADAALGSKGADSQRGAQGPATFRADLEDLLPLVSVKSSVPPTLPALPEGPARVQDFKRNRLSLAFFGAMLLASAVSLARYATSHSESAPARAPEADQESDAQESAANPPATPAPLPEKLPADPMLEALAQAETGLPDDPAAAADQLMNLGLKALAAGNERYAEALLGRALKHDDDNPRAYFALARIRLSQGNLQGAEGWIVSALHKRPRRAEYHALYATVLEGLGRREEAAKARARANALRDERSE